MVFLDDLLGSVVLLFFLIVSLDGLVRLFTPFTIIVYYSIFIRNVVLTSSGLLGTFASVLHYFLNLKPPETLQIFKHSSAKSYREMTHSILSTLRESLKHESRSNTFWKLEAFKSTWAASKVRQTLRQIWEGLGETEFIVLYFERLNIQEIVPDGVIESRNSMHTLLRRFIRSWTFQDFSLCEKVEEQLNLRTPQRACLILRTFAHSYLRSWKHCKKNSDGQVHGL